MNARHFAAAVLIIGAAHTPPAFASTCPTSTLYVANLPDPLEISGPTATGSMSDGYLGGVSYHFREFGDSVYFRYAGCCGSGSLTVRNRYRFLGPPPGTSVSNQVQTRVTAWVYGYGGDPCEGTRASISGYMGTASVNAQRALPPDDNCYGSLALDMPYTCTQQVGNEFALTTQISLTIAEGFSERAEVSTRRRFGLMPPGAFIVRCDGDTSAQVVGVEAELASGLRIASIWPNPSRGEFRANLTVPAGGAAFVRLLDISGRVVESRVWDASRAASRELTFGSQLAPGHYFLQVSQGATSAVRAVTIRR